MTEKKRLAVSRLIIFILPLLSLLLSLYCTNIVAVLYTAGLFYSTAVFVPMVTGMYSDRPTAHGGLVAIVGTTVFSLAWEYFLAGYIPYIGNVPSNIMGLLCGLILLFVFSEKRKA